MTFSPTPEQLAILSAGRTDSGNIMIRALAGTGKTATLELLEKVVPKKPILYLVFNKRNADEAKKRMATTTQVLTFNSIGHRIWGATIGKSLRVESGKVGDILREIINASPRSEQSVLWATYSLVVDGVARAKAIGYVPEGKFPSANHHCSRHDFIRALEEEPDDLTLGLIDEVLFRSIRAAYAGTIDFNDQVYMTALFASQAMFPRYPTVLVDEYQDLNPTNHVIIDRLLRGGGRLIGVGDPNQNIYGFRGAKAGGMASAITRYEMQTFGLTLSFRCPSAIVSGVHWHVPEFRASRIGGSIDHPPSLDPTLLPADAIILCRNNAPLFSFALKLLALGRSVSVAGSDIGPRLVKQMRKLGDEDMKQRELLEQIALWLQDKLDRQSTTAQDMADCMRVFARFGANLGQALAYAEHLFAAQGPLRLMTGHKSKGLEWPQVYFLDQHILKPSEQDNNLSYVMATRSSDALTYIRSDAVEWPLETADEAAE